MANLAQTLKIEISRLARRELRRDMDGTKKLVGQYRRDIANLKRQVQQQTRTIAFLETQERRRLAQSPPKELADGGRFSASWVKAHRRRLDLSAARYGKLVGVSSLTIYNWEQGKSRPGTPQLAAWAAVRHLGKRDAHRRLEMLRA